MTGQAYSQLINFTGRVLKTTDKLGRTLVIQSLVATQRQQLAKIFGECWESPYFARPAEVFASIRAIDGRAYDFPKNEKEFYTLVEAVEVEGMEATVLALERENVRVDGRVQRFIDWIGVPLNLGSGDVA